MPGCEIPTLAARIVSKIHKRKRKSLEFANFQVNVLCLCLRLRLCFSLWTLPFNGIGAKCCVYVAFAFTFHYEWALRPTKCCSVEEEKEGNWHESNPRPEVTTLTPDHGGGLLKLSLLYHSCHIIPRCIMLRKIISLEFTSCLALLHGNLYSFPKKGTYVI